jgi:hypothetical protein
VRHAQFSLARRGPSTHEAARREFITLLGGATVWPLTARAQQTGGTRRIGVLVSNVETDPQIQGQVAAFRQSLEQLGWFEGRNIQIELRSYAGDYARLPQLAQEMVALKPDVIFAGTTPTVRALQAKTRTIPIVFVYVSDPVGAGAESLAIAELERLHLFLEGAFHRLSCALHLLGRGTRGGWPAKAVGRG